MAIRSNVVRHICLSMLLGMLGWSAAPVLLLAQQERRGGQEAGQVTKYVRFMVENEEAYGRLEGDRVRRIEGDLFSSQWQVTDQGYALDDVQLLVPTKPTNVIALAGNYRDHLGDQAEPGNPEAFFKPVSCLQHHEGEILQPTEAEPVHHEAELVIVIGKQAKAVSEQDAPDYVFGVTCGNDISARAWQQNDVQWWRAKGSDTFGPCGPCIATNIDYGNLKMVCRVNGEVRQETNTKQMIFSVPEIVSFISQYITLQPGDLIFTGTAGETTPLYQNDIVEIEVEGVGVLRNKVIYPE